MSVVVRWTAAAWNYFWSPRYNGTPQQQAQQETRVQNFGATQVAGARSAEITAPGHAGGTNPNEPWHITARYYDVNGRQIHSPSPHGGAWHVY